MAAKGFVGCRNLINDDDKVYGICSKRESELHYLGVHALAHYKNNTKKEIIEALKNIILEDCNKKKENDKPKRFIPYEEYDPKKDILDVDFHDKHIDYVWKIFSGIKIRTHVKVENLQSIIFNIKYSYIFNIKADTFEVYIGADKIITIDRQSNFNFYEEVFKNRKKYVTKYELFKFNSPKVKLMKIDVNEFWDYIKELSEKQI